MAGENRKGSRSVGGSFARAIINSRAASLAVDSARLSARILCCHWRLRSFLPNGQQFPCRNPSCRTATVPAVFHSAPPSGTHAYLTELLVGGLSVVAIQTYGIRETIAAICTPRRRGAAARRAAGAGSLKPSRPSFSVTDTVVWGAARFESVISVHVVGSLAPCPTAIGVRTGTSRPCRARDLRDRPDQPRGTCRHEPARCVRACRRVAP